MWQRCHWGGNLTTDSEIKICGSKLFVWWSRSLCIVTWSSIRLENVYLSPNCSWVVGRSRFWRMCLVWSVMKKHKFTNLDELDQDLALKLRCSRRRLNTSNTTKLVLLQNLQWVPRAPSVQRPIRSSLFLHFQTKRTLIFIISWNEIPEILFTPPLIYLPHESTIKPSSSVWVDVRCGGFCGMFGVRLLPDGSVFVSLCAFVLLLLWMCEWSPKNFSLDHLYLWLQITFPVALFP